MVPPKVTFVPTPVLHISLDVKLEYETQMRRNAAALVRDNQFSRAKLQRTATGSQVDVNHDWTRGRGLRQIGESGELLSCSEMEVVRDEST